MSSFRKWFGMTTESKEIQRYPSAKKLPFLPPKRASILTPSPSCETLLLSANNYGLFQRLPYEIRRAILVEAFGDVVLHVDLLYRRPLVRKPTAQGMTCRGRDYEMVESKKPPAWLWTSGVCHRGEKEMEAGFDKLINLHMCCVENGCTRGSRWCPCATSPCYTDDQDPAACFIGIMGWLLACRKA